MTETTVTLPPLDAVAPLLSAAVGQLEFTRQYLLELLDATPRSTWYEIPSGLPTSIAWQVGHLTVSQYGLLMFRIRGRKPEDLKLIPGRFRKAYGRGSVPSANPDAQPTTDELMERLTAVDRLARSELAELSPKVLLEPVEMPYAVYPVKLGAVLFCPLHEQVHAGQIGLLRRALGLEPIR